MTDKPQRYHLLDAIRGVAVLNMIVFHLLYNIYCGFGVWPGFPLSTPVVIWERFICCTFIIVSGMSINFSRHGYRRGCIVFLCGAVVTAVTVLFIPEQSIWWGVLSLLGTAMVITFALRKVLNRIAPIIGMIGAFIPFMLTYGVPNGYIGLFSHPLLKLPDALYQYNWLAFLGFPGRSFSSSDYFPILPWIFLYIFGYFLWRLIEQRQLQGHFLRKIPVLDFIGRHSLIIYMAHQPILYGLCWLYFSLT